MIIMKQVWFCENCVRKGTVVLDDCSSDVLSVVRFVRNAHRASSPGCTKDPRILNPNHPEAKEYEELISLFRPVVV